MKILLKDGLVYDGSRNKPQRLDVLLKGGLIKEIGKGLSEDNAQIINCNGLVVAPGFIDAHSHNDFFIKKDEAILPFLRQGITTQIVGNCGFSAYGADPNSPFNHHIGGSLFSYDNPGSLKDFVDDVGDTLVNIVPLVGHGSTRISVTGMQARKQTTAELNQQLELLERDLAAGAFGGSFGLMYEPGMHAPQEELVEFAKLIKQYNGILTVHPRANSKVALGYSLFGKPHIERALDEVITITRKSKVKTQYSHLIFVGSSSWNCVDSMLEMFNKAREEGLEIDYDIYPFTYGASTISVILPDWYLKMPLKKRNKSFTKLRLKLLINITKRLLGIDFDDLVITYIEGYPQYEGKNVAEIAKEENLKPFDMYLKLVNLSNGEGRIMLGKYYNDEIIKKLMLDPSSIYMTDAWYEDSGIQNGGTFQAFPLFLEKTKEYNIPLEDTINKMTGKTALRFGIDSRGFIKQGYAADITVFDFAEIAVDQSVIETPPGIKYVIVNGKIVIDNNKYTNVRSGRVLLKK